MTAETILSYVTFSDINNLYIQIHKLELENIKQSYEFEKEKLKLKSEIHSLNQALEMDRILMENCCHINHENIFCDNKDDGSDEVFYE